MRRDPRPSPAAALFVLLFAQGAFIAPSGAAMYKCVDKAGRVTYVDKLTTECLDQGRQEMNSGGVIKNKVVPAPVLTPEQRKANEEEAARRKVEEAKLAEQRRQDNALLATYTSEKDIEVRRDRDLNALEANLGQTRASLKAATERAAAQRSIVASPAPKKHPDPDKQKDIEKKRAIAIENAKTELAAAEADRARLEKQLAAQEKEIAATRAKYQEFTKRYRELRAAEGQTATR